MLRKTLILTAVVATLLVAAVVGGRSARQLDQMESPGQTYEASSGAERLSSAPKSARLGTGNREFAAQGAPSTSGGAARVSGSDDTVTGPTTQFRGTKVIKTANIELRVPKGQFQTRFDRASALAEELGGFVTDSSVEESSKRAASGTITIRIPSDRHAAAISRLKSLGKVTSEIQSGQDVSKEFVDLEARLRHAKTQEAFYLKLMTESKSVSDLLQVQQQLSSLQLEIEQIQGQLEYLKDQTSYSTVTARIFEPGAATTSPPKRLGLAWQQALTGFQNVLGGLVITFGYISPFLLLILLGLGIWRIARIKTRSAASTS